MKTLRVLGDLVAVQRREDQLYGARIYIEHCSKEHVLGESASIGRRRKRCRSCRGP